MHNLGSMMLARDIWGPLGAALGIVGILLAVPVGWWFARGPRLYVQISGATIISSPDNDRISVYYDQDPVPRVTQSLVWLWRRGRGTVRGDDVHKRDLIRISVPSGNRILDASVIKQSVETNEVRIDFDSAEPHVTDTVVQFDYLDPAQGVVIELTTRRSHRMMY
jgi:hypothetical protein